jgi:hypothetical protein
MKSNILIILMFVSGCTLETTDKPQSTQTAAVSHVFKRLSVEEREIVINKLVVKYTLTELQSMFSALPSYLDLSEIDRHYKTILGNAVDQKALAEKADHKTKETRQLAELIEELSVAGP